MKKLIKRLFVLTLVLVASLGFSTVVFAAEIDTNGKAESATGDNEINIPKEIEMKSSGTRTVYAPNISYTYELSNGTAATVGDYQIKAGDVSYLDDSSNTDVTVSFTNTDSAESGSNVKKLITYTFDPTKFPSAGIYRYKITETGTSVSPASVGILRETNYDTEKYLDVYVNNNDAGEKIITGYVLMNDDTSGTKSPGWNHDPDLEHYRTYSLIVTKNILGSLADKTAKFPFKITLNGEMTNNKIDIDAASTGESLVLGNITEGSGTTPDTRDVTGLLGDEKTIIITGIPYTVSFDVGEKNPTGDVYKATAISANIDDGATLANNMSLSKNSTTYETVVSGAAKTLISGDATITVSNTLDSPSPTGVILYFAPYILIGRLAVLLLVISVKSKKRVQA